MNIAEVFFVIAAVILILMALMALLAIVSRNIVKVPPNMVAVFSGRKRTVTDPATGQRRTVGYRIVKGGSSVRIPIIERVDFLSLNVMTIPLKIASAYTKEGVPVSVDAVANVKIGSDDVMVMNAIERFLGMPQEQIRNVIFQTLEGHLRSILGTLTVEQINADRQAFAQRLAAESAQDLSRMGIEIDVLTIQQISDPQGYLDALGQRRTAEVKRDAEIGKAEAERDARKRRAQAMQEAAVAEAMAEAEIAAAQKETNAKKARFDAEVEAEKARASQAGPLAEAEARRQVVVAEQQVELARTEAAIAVQEMEARRREKELEATVLKQAEAERQATIITAEGEKQAAIVKAEGDRQATITRAEAEARQRELVGQGEAARIRQVGQAEADAKKALADAVQAELLAQAEGQKAALLAEAEGKRAALIAEAEGKRALAAALNAYGPTAMQLLMYQAFVEQLPKVVEAAARPLAQIERVVLIDSNGAGGDGHSALGRYATGLPLIVQQMTESFAALTGIDLVKLAQERLGQPDGGDVSSDGAAPSPAEAQAPEAGGDPSPGAAADDPAPGEESAGASEAPPASPRA
ncbi:SPFH domain-containing protein [Thermomicrobiaceae bacterium CFH 74404]|uniref:SPFH domain-containing protein n=1 Tax=Thermalbibacter longus TaxID=2951981 RepID=A0AA41WHQ3_9BACT|nr:flotillin family protein [Thermalbibacter longus]MCM8750328.1 SPFH domain-containing protein [Thermalbibacter longus]